MGPSLAGPALPWRGPGEGGPAGRGLCWGPPCPDGSVLRGLELYSAWQSALTRHVPPQGLGTGRAPCLLLGSALGQSPQCSAPAETGAAFPDTVRPWTCPAWCTGGLIFEVALVPALRSGGLSLPPTLPGWHLPPTSLPAGTVLQSGPLGAAFYRIQGNLLTSN